MLRWMDVLSTGSTPQTITMVLHLLKQRAPCLFAYMELSEEKLLLLLFGPQNVVQNEKSLNENTI